MEAIDGGDVRVDVREENGETTTHDVDSLTTDEVHSVDVEPDSASQARTPFAEDASTVDVELPKLKKRRRIEDLGFSSPGPAFLSFDSDGVSTEAEGGEMVRTRRRPKNVAEGRSSVTAEGSTSLSTLPLLSLQQVDGSRSHNQLSKSAHSTHPTHAPPKPNGALAHNGGSASVSSAGASKSIFRNWTPKKKNKMMMMMKDHNGDAPPVIAIDSSDDGSLSESGPADVVESGKGRPKKHQYGHRHPSSKSLVGKGERRTHDGLSNAKRNTLDNTPTSTDQRTPSTVTQRKDLLVDARRTEMDAVYTEHDHLVRELFHLRKFITYIGFDPEVALQDRSDVFERFRMDYDLATLLSGATGRATRRLVSAKRGDLSLPAHKAHGAGFSRSRRAGRESEDDDDTTTTTREKRTKKKEVERGGATASGARRRRASSSAASGAVSVSSGEDERRTRPPPKKRGRKSAAEKASSSRRRDEAVLLDSSDDEEADEELAPSANAAQYRKGRRGRPPKATYEPKKPVEIERIKGIPPLRALKPANLPLASHFNHSLSRYLDSWLTSGEFVGANGDLETLSMAELSAREEQLAHIYMRIDELRAQGLLQDREDALRKSQQNRSHEAVRTQTTWDAVLSQIAPYSARQRADVRNKVALAKRTARMVQVYWDEKLGRGEKHRKAEERRIRALAKFTVREVRKQWKLAVNVIRAQRSAREKQEKDRVGREQLKSILEQSSQMLSEQHKALLEMEAQADESEDSDSDSDDEESEDDSSEESDLDVSDASSSLAESQAEDEKRGDHAVNGAESEASVDDAEEEEGSESIDSESDHADLAQLLLPRSPLASEVQGDEETAATSSPMDDLSSIDGMQSPLLKITDNDFDPDQEIRPVRTVRRSQSASLLKDSIRRAAGDVEDNDDDDVFDGTALNSADEDAELDRKMWEEDESESDDDDGDMDEDALLSVEELREKYNFGVQSNTPAAEESSDEETAEQSERDLLIEATDGDASTPAQRDELHDDRETESSRENNSTRKHTLVQSDHSHTATSTPASDRPSVKVKPPFLLRGNLRPYQQIGFEWLVNLYNSGSNGILADEMGLGKTIQTISLLGHLACDKGNWGPHLVVAPTSVMLNWEVEFKKFLPGFKVLSYYGSQRERKEKRKGWNTENAFNVCITSYQLILADQHILRRKPWQYLVLDEAHHIKNFRSQRWQTLLGFNSQRRLLLTGTPLQNNLMDLWSLMYFLMPNGATNVDGVVSSGFASMKEFQQWFSNPLDRAVESAGIGTVSEEMDVETKGMVSKLHTLLRPYLLRRLKSEVEREMPAKYEHVIRCRLSKRQQFLYNDFMSRAKTRESLASGNYLSIINCLMQLRKVCNHPDLFEQRPIVTSFAMDRSAVADFEIKDLLVRRALLEEDKHLSSGSYVSSHVSLDALNLRICSSSKRDLTPITSRSLSRLDASDQLPHVHEKTDEPGPIDTWSVEGYAQSIARHRQARRAAKWQHFAYLNRLRCQAAVPRLFDKDSVGLIESIGNGRQFYPLSAVQEESRTYMNRCDAVHAMIRSNEDRREDVQGFIDRFAFVTPRAVCTDMVRWALPGLSYDNAPQEIVQEGFDTLHAPAVKLQIAFPDASLLQYDCGKLQELDKLMQHCKYGSHRILIFTQMTKILDILEIWLNFNGFNYLRLDGSTKVEDRQSLTEKFNRDDRIKAFILSTRSGGLGINLTGADMVLFWDLDWNFQIEAQCMDRAHRIGQTRDVHIYRFVSEHTIEENMLKKSQEKRLLDAMVIQDGQFTTEGLGKMSWIESMFDEGSRSIAGVRVGGGGNGVGEDTLQSGQAATDAPNDQGIELAMDAAEDEEDAQAARTARAEIHVIDDEFASEMGGNTVESSSKDVDTVNATAEVERVDGTVESNEQGEGRGEKDEEVEDDDEEGGTVDEYMLRLVDADWEYFSTL